MRTIERQSHLSPPRHCPVCGGRLDYDGDQPSGHPVCLECGRPCYLDPKVCACVLIEDQGRVLLARRSEGRPEAGRWNLPGGFVDRGEMVEAAAEREVREEVGLDVELGGLVGVFSYPDDPVVAIVYAARLRAGRLFPGAETDQVAWFKPDLIPWDALAFRTTGDALKKYFAIG